jgi:hypothetical protein
MQHRHRRRTPSAVQVGHHLGETTQRVPIGIGAPERVDRHLEVEGAFELLAPSKPFVVQERRNAPPRELRGPCCASRRLYDSYHAIIAD